MPPPLRAMTTPSNTWTRSRPPSTTRTCTFTVSPERNSGTSSRNRAFSKSCRSFIGGLLVESTGVITADRDKADGLG